MSIHTDEDGRMWRTSKGSISGDLDGECYYRVQEIGLEFLPDFWKTEEFLTFFDQAQNAPEKARDHLQEMMNTERALVDVARFWITLCEFEFFQSPVWLEEEFTKKIKLFWTQAKSSKIFREIYQETESVQASGEERQVWLTEEEKAAEKAIWAGMDAN